MDIAYRPAKPEDLAEAERVVQGRLTRCVYAMAGSPGRRHLRPPFRNSAWRKIPPGFGSRKTATL